MVTEGDFDYHLPDCENLPDVCIDDVSRPRYQSL